MSIIADGSLTNVQPSIGESRRATTPSKLFNRQTTPQRSGSAPRSSSNNRERIVSDINLDPRVVHTGPARPISVRRQRRWENKNMFGLEDGKTKEERILEALEHADLGKEGIPFEISWRSTLSELLKPKNHQLLHDFVHCKDSFEVKIATKKDPADMSDWEAAEALWIKIEKRIRAAITRSYGASEVIRLFLADLERILLHFAHTGQALTTGHFCDELKKELAQPIFVDKSGNLVVPLQESAFRRLLVHGVAQFYGLQSNSVKAKGQQEKACLIKPLRRSSAPSSATPSADADPKTTAPGAKRYTVPQSVVRCLSLVQFLSLRKEQTAAGTEEDGETAQTGMLAADGQQERGQTAWARATLAHLQRRLACLSLSDVAALASAESTPHIATDLTVELSCGSYECVTGVDSDPSARSPASGPQRSFSGDLDAGGFVVVPR